MRVRCFVVGACLGGVLLARPALAVTFEDSVDDLRLEFAPKGATICVAAPPSETKSEDCAGINVASLREVFPGFDKVLAVRHGATSYLLTYRTSAKMSGQMWAESIDAEAGREFPGETIKVKNPEIVIHRRIGKAEVMRYDLVVTSPPDPDPLVLVNYLIPAGTKHYELQIREPASRAAVAQADVEAALPTLHVKISPMAMLWVAFEKLGLVFLGGAAVLGAIVISFVLLRKKTRPS